MAAKKYDVHRDHLEYMLLPDLISTMSAVDKAHYSLVLDDPTLDRIQNNLRADQKTEHLARIFNKVQLYMRCLPFCFLWKLREYALIPAFCTYTLSALWLSLSRLCHSCVMHALYIYSVRAIFEHSKIMPPLSAAPVTFDPVKHTFIGGRPENPNQVRILFPGLCVGEEPHQVWHIKASVVRA